MAKKRKKAGLKFSDLKFSGTIPEPHDELYRKLNDRARRIEELENTVKTLRQEHQQLARLAGVGESPSEADIEADRLAAQRFLRRAVDRFVIDLSTDLRQSKV